MNPLATWDPAAREWTGLYGLGKPLDPRQAAVPLRRHASHRFGGIVQPLLPDAVPGTRIAD
jgi:hypothetical protein